MQINKVVIWATLRRGSASKDATRDVFGRSAADVQLGASSLVFAEGVARCVVQGVQPVSG